MAKVKTKLTVDAFRATLSMLPPIPALRIALIDEGSPLWIPDDIPEEPLQSSPPKLTIDENIQHIISVLKDKGKKPISESYQAHYSEPPPKSKSGWSQEEINQALEENIRIQALKDNPNTMLGLSPLFRE